jgi:orotidine-5'-phosphate decarboxylase
MFNKRYGLILSIDVSTIVEAQKIAELSLRFDEIVGYKVGFTLGLRYGLSLVVEALKKINPLSVIYDHQKAGSDIPQMGMPFAQTCKDGGVDGVIFFPQAGPKTLEAFVEGALSTGLIPIIGGVMTHQAYLESEGGFIADKSIEKIYKMGIELGVSNFVLPGTKPDIIRKIAQGVLSKKPMTLMMPGFGTQGGSIKEAFEAASGHQVFPIVGSAIYKASCPYTAALEIVNELKTTAGKYLAD